MEKLMKDSQGFGLIQMLFIVGMIAASSLAVTSLMEMQSDGQYQTALKTSMLGLKQNLMGAITSQAAWNQSRAHNSAMTCSTANQRYCDPSRPTERALINLYDAHGNQILDSATRPTRGFNIYGEPCNNYSPAGSPSCPIRVEVTWRAACTSGTCTPAIAASGIFQASELVSINFIYSPGNSHKKVAFNPSLINLVEQARFNLQSKTTPVLACAYSGRVFIGQGKNINGVAADSRGCVPYNAFQGPKGSNGPPGAPGPAGAAGARGIPGPPGAPCG